MGMAGARSPTAEEEDMGVIDLLLFLLVGVVNYTG
jgi:hypothetical protein